MAGWAKTILRAAAISAAAGAGVYAASAAWEWSRLGEGPRRRADPLLDAYLPEFDIEECYRTRVRASPEAVFAAARELDAYQSPVVQALFQLRGWVMGARSDSRERPPEGMIDAMRAIGWAVLEEIPGERIVMGAVTRPWEANVVFEGLPAQDFVDFDQPEYVKIMWTIRAEAGSGGGAWLVTETRAFATDPAARQRFRNYWPLVSPGTKLIRLFVLRLAKRKAESAVGLHPVEHESA